MERLIISVCADVHERLFESLYEQLSPGIKTAIDDLLVASPGDQRSLFYLLKEYPSSATITSIQRYLERYRALGKTVFPAAGGSRKLAARTLERIRSRRDS